MLDTNIVIALWNFDAAVLAKLPGRTLVTCSIIAGELYFGAYKSARTTANVQRVERYVASNHLLNCDAETARYYGQVKQGLQAKGRPIPENDVWIAALALQHNTVLVTRDRHFNEVDGLSVEVW